jgi:hypothetical protein
VVPIKPGNSGGPQRLALPRAREQHVVVRAAARGQGQAVRPGAQSRLKSALRSLSIGVSIDARFILLRSGACAPAGKPQHHQRKQRTDRATTNFVTLHYTRPCHSRQYMPQSARRTGILFTWKQKKPERYPSGSWSIFLGYAPNGQSRGGLTAWPSRSLRSHRSAAWRPCHSDR